MIEMNSIEPLIDGGAEFRAKRLGGLEADVRASEGVEISRRTRQGTDMRHARRHGARDSGVIILRLRRPRAAAPDFRLNDAVRKLRERLKQAPGRAAIAAFDIETEDSQDSKCAYGLPVTRRPVSSQPRWKAASTTDKPGTNGPSPWEYSDGSNSA